MIKLHATYKGNRKRWILSEPGECTAATGNTTTNENPLYVCYTLCPVAQCSVQGYTTSNRLLNICNITCHNLVLYVCLSCHN